MAGRKLREQVNLVPCPHSCQIWLPLRFTANIPEILAQFICQLGILSSVSIKAITLLFSIITTLTFIVISITHILAGKGTATLPSYSFGRTSIIEHLQLPQPLLLLNSWQSWKMYRRQMSLNPHLQESSSRSSCAHTDGWIHAPTPAVHLKANTEWHSLLLFCSKFSFLF